MSGDDISYKSCPRRDVRGEWKWGTMCLLEGITSLSAKTMYVDNLEEELGISLFSLCVIW